MISDSVPSGQSGMTRGTYANVPRSADRTTSVLWSGLITSAIKLAIKLTIQLKI